MTINRSQIEDACLRPGETPNSGIIENASGVSANGATGGSEGSKPNLTNIIFYSGLGVVVLIIFVLCFQYFRKSLSSVVHTEVRPDAPPAVKSHDAFKRLQDDMKKLEDVK
jgi:hypothetical protein